MDCLTCEDVVKKIVNIDDITTPIRTNLYDELEMVMRNANLEAEWGIISLNVHQCAGWTIY